MSFLAPSRHLSHLTIFSYEFCQLFFNLFCFVKVIVQLLALIWSLPKAFLFYSYKFCSCLGTVEGVLEPGMSSTTARSMTILQHIPFVVRFKDRVKVRRFYHHRLLVTPTNRVLVWSVALFLS